MEPINTTDDLTSLGNQFLLFNIAEKDQPESIGDNFIQHKIDSKNLTQIKWSKLQELLQESILNYSSCHYELRIYNILNNDDCVSDILSKIKKLSETLNCTCDIIKTKQGIYGIFFEFFLQLKNKNLICEINKEKKNKIQEIKIGTFGEESSGKSTTTSVLINNSLDDGKGMGGCEKALKYTLSLISPDYIDYAFLFIDYKNGPTENTKKLFTLNYSMHLPMICIITMIDLIKDKNEKELLDFIEKSLKYFTIINPNLKAILIKEKSDILDYISKLSNIGYENYFPIICISNTNGNNIDLLKFMISLLPPSSNRAIPLILNNLEKFDVHEHFTVNGTTILGGIVSKGIIKKNDTYYFGPNKLGNFKYVKVETIHCKRQEVDIAHEGQFSSLSLTGKNYDPNEVSKGMCLIGTNTTLVPKAVRRFKADVWWIGEEQAKEMKYKCEPVVIINHIRETCKIINLNKNNNCLINRSFTENSSTSVSITSKTESYIDIDDENTKFTKKKKKIKMNMKENTFWLFRDEKMELFFEFKNFPKYINEGQNIIINDNTFKAFGIITKVFYNDDDLFGKNKIKK